jgi:ribosomal protein S12 methylthiotransferase
MNRRYTRRDLENLIAKIRRRNLALRSTVIVGFPGEGEAEFKELLDFIRKVKFERLGCFTYQKEKGTPANKMGEQVSEKVKIERFQRLMRRQARISREKGNKMIGRTLDIIIEKAARGGFVGRSYMDAPEIDGSVLAKTNKSLKPGGIVAVRITGARTYDLIGCLT